MPRALNPGNIASGGGLAAAKSVEATSFVHPTQGLDSVIAHIVDPSRAHMARAVGLQDPGGYYASDHVEGALQEIGGGFASGTQNGVISGGTFSSVGLTLTLGATLVRIGTEHDLSGQSILLTASQTNWVYVNTSAVLSVVTGASPPSITSPENVLLWRVTTSGVAVTASVDARFFIPNLDRKLAFTVRSSGTATDRNAEACFEDIRAAMLYLEHFTATGASRKTKLIVRGANTISATVTVPVDDLIVEGEDGAEFVTGATVVPMFDCGARDRVQFRDILFTNNHAGSWAISGSDFEGGGVERCRFQGAQPWERAIASTLSTTSFVVRDCFFTVSNYGIFLESPTNCLVEGCVIFDTSLVGIAGIVLGDAMAGAGPNVVTRCTVSGFGTIPAGTSVAVRGPDAHIADCRLANAVTGVTVAASATSHRLRVTNSLINLNSSTGMIGVSLADDTDDVQVQGCTIANARGAGTYLVGDVPKGIQVGPSGCDRFTATGCTISGFYNSVGDLGRGVDVGGSPDATVADCNIATAHTGIFADASAVNFKSSGCRVQDAVVGLEVAGDQSSVSGATILLSSSIGLTGIILGSGADDSRVSGCFIRNPRAVYGVGDLPVGIAVTLCARVQIADCIIRDFRNTTTPTLGFGISVANPASDDLTITGGHIQETATGISLNFGVERAKIANVYINDADTGIDLAGANSTLSNCSIDLNAATGVDGVLAGGVGITITGCRINNPRTVWGIEVPRGIRSNATGLKADNCHIEGFTNPGVNGAGVMIDPGSGSCTLSDCTFLNCFDGVQTANAGLADVSITGCRFDIFESHGVLADHVTRLTVSECQFKNGGNFAIVELLNCLDVVVTGNFLDGNAGASDNGIHLSGQDAAGEYARRFTVTGNTLQAFGGHGIVLEGYVQNGTVSGNQVDGFLPLAPLNPTALAGIRLYTVAGAGLSAPKHVTISGNTVQRCWKGIVIEGTLADPIREVTVDGNVVHHCAFGQANGAIGNFHSFGSVGVGVEQVRRVTVSNNTIYKIGIQIDDSDVEGFPAGVAVQGMGIVVNNTIGSTVVGNTITDTMANGTGFNTGIYVHQGSVGHGGGNTFTNTGVIVNDNNCFWNTGLAGNGEAGDGIIVQVEKGTDAATALHVMENVEVDGNTIHNCDFANILVLASQECTLRGVVLEGNTVSRCDSVGIDVFTFSTVTAVSQVSVRGNAVRDVFYGCRLHAGGAGTFTNCAVEGNNISSTEANGVLVEATNVAVTVTDIAVRGNTIRNHATGGSGSGILLFCPGASVTAFRGFTVSDNDVVDVASTGASGIEYIVTGVDTSDLIVQGNKVNSPGGLGSSGNGISILTSASGVTNANMKRVTIAGNHVCNIGRDCVYVDVDGYLHDLSIAGNTLAAESPGRPIYVLTNRTNAAASDDDYVQNVRIEGNACTGRFDGGTLTNRGSRIELLNGNKLRSLTVSNNTFADTVTGGLAGSRAGFSLDMVTVRTVGTSPAVEGAVFSGNTFRSCTGEGLAIRLGGTTDDLLDGVVGVTVIGNTFTGCAIGTTDADTLLYKVNGATRNLLISNNTFADCDSSTPIDAVTIGTVHVLVGSDTGIDNENIVIQGNSITDCGGVGILFEDDTEASVFRLRDLVIRGNTVNDQTNDAIRVDMAAFVSTPIFNVAIDGNTIDSVSGTASDVGIVVLGSASQRTNQLSVRGNTTSATGGGAGGTTGAIYVNMPDDVADVRIDRNSIETAATVSGIVLTVGGGTLLASVSRNTISDPTSLGIDLNLGSVESLHVSENVLHQDTLSGTSAGIDLLASGGTITACSISGNSIYQYGSGIEINQTGAATRGLTINGNTVANANANGISFANTDSINSLTISNNVVTEFGATTASSGIEVTQIGAAGGKVAHNVSITGNTVRTTDADAHFGYLVDIGNVLGTPAPEIRNLVVANNTAELAVGGSHSLKVDLTTTGTTNCANAVFSGNILRGSSNGIFGASTNAYFTTTDLVDSIAIGNISDSATEGWNIFANGWTGDSFFSVAATPQSLNINLGT